VDTPGLIERRLIKEWSPLTVEIEEHWDLTVPGCPMIAVRSMPFEIAKDIKTVTRRVFMSKAAWMYK